MLTYKYEARDPASGQKIKAEVSADSEQSAAHLIKEQGYSPLKIELKEGEGKSFLGRFGKRVKTKDKIIFSRQLATLLNAGLPLVQSLRSAGEQSTNKPLKAVVGKLLADIEAGKSFSEALRQHPNVFDNVFISLIAAGEASGTLDAALERLSTQQEKDAELLSKVRGAMVYPAVVLLVMVGVVVFMITTVLPQVEVLYQGLPGARLPLLTRVLLSISKGLLRYWYLFLLFLGITSFFTFRWVQTVTGRSFFDRLKMRVPPFAQLFMKVYMARFARTGTTLVASGVPLVQTLEITSNSVDNVHIKKSIERAITRVKGGEALSKALENDDNFLALVPNMLHVGEQSGAIEKMLEKTADYYEKEVDNQIKTISTIIEPVLMIVLGVVAFVLVAAILLPIYSLVGKTIIR